MPLRSTITGLVLACAALMAGCDGAAVSSVFPKLGLYFNQDDQAANLAYGEANSDDVDVMLQCAKGSRLIELTDVAPGKPNEPLILVAGDEKTVLAPRLSTDETGAPLAEATLPADAPVLQDFRRGKVLGVTLGGARYGLKARREEQAAVSSFFDACGL